MSLTLTRETDKKASRVKNPFPLAIVYIVAVT